MPRAACPARQAANVGSEGADRGCRHRRRPLRTDEHALVGVDVDPRVRSRLDRLDLPRAPGRRWDRGLRQPPRAPDPPGWLGRPRSEDDKRQDPPRLLPEGSRHLECRTVGVTAGARAGQDRAAARRARARPAAVSELADVRADGDGDALAAQTPPGPPPEPDPRRSTRGRGRSAGRPGARAQSCRWAATRAPTRPGARPRAGPVHRPVLDVEPVPGRGQQPSHKFGRPDALHGPVLGHVIPPPLGGTSGESGSMSPATRRRSGVGRPDDDHDLPARVRLVDGVDLGRWVGRGVELSHRLRSCCALSGGAVNAVRLKYPGSRQVTNPLCDWTFPAHPG